MALRVIDSLALRIEPLILLLGRICHRIALSDVGRSITGGTCTAHSFHDGLARFGECLGDADGDHRGRIGAALVLGFRTRDFALLLVIFNLCAATIGHHYWSITGDATAHWGQFIHFWKDIGLAGGALFVLARGAGPLASTGDDRRGRPSAKRRPLSKSRD